MIGGRIRQIQARQLFFSSFFSFSRSSHIIILIVLLVLRVSCVFPCHRPFGILLSMGGHGIFYVVNDFSTCCAHEDKTGTDDSAQVLTVKNPETVLDPASTGSRTRGSRFHWITSAAR